MVERHCKALHPRFAAALSSASRCMLSEPCFASSAHSGASPSSFLCNSTTPWVCVFPAAVIRNARCPDPLGVINNGRLAIQISTGASTKGSVRWVNGTSFNYGEYKRHRGESAASVGGGYRGNHGSWNPFLARRAHTPLAQRQNLGDKVGLIFRTTTSHLAIRNYILRLSITEPPASYAKPIIAAPHA